MESVIDDNRLRDPPLSVSMVDDSTPDSGSVPIPLHSSERARLLVPYEVAMRYRFLPMNVLTSRSGRLVTIAGDVSHISRLTPEIEFALGERIRPIPYRGDHLERDIERAYLGSETRLFAAAARAKGERDTIQTRTIVDTGHPQLRDNSESGISSFVASLVEFAIARGASDLHMAPMRDRVLLGLRIGREMHYLTESLCERGVFERVSGRLKVLAGANPTIRTVPLDGSFSVELATESVGIRFSSLPTVFGERIVLRISRGGAIHPIEGLGFDQRTQHLIEEYVVRGSGLSLVVGPTGSGKTTSLYGIIRRLVDLGKVVLSIEDPVERWMEGVSQTSLNEQSGLTFGAVAKAALRQGPDVLVIGEIRDAESAFTAMKMALSGHLVLSTIHARCVFEALERFSSLSQCRVSELQGLSAIVAQRLISPLHTDASLEPTLLLATQTLVMSPEVQRLVKNDSVGRGEFYRSIQEGLFLPFENYARRWLEEGIIGMEEYRNLVRLDE